jgi:polysaccharide biosynthesis protein PslG
MSLRSLASLAPLAVALLATGCGGRDGPEAPPLPEERPLIGFNEAVTPADARDELFAASGASFMRVPLSWASVETEQGTRNFDAPDAIRDGLAELGLRPLWVVTSAPCWAGMVPCAQPRPSLAPAPEHYGDYADFLAEVAERYPGAVGLEVWNEPNVPNFWRPEPDAAAYRELLTRAVDAVHETGSEVPVVMAGPSPMTGGQAVEDDRKIPQVDFIEAVMAGADAPEVDAIGIHPYSLLQVGREPVAETIRLFERARGAAERVAPGLPVWVTEVGLTTGGRHRISPAEQAEGLEEIVATFADEEVPLIAIHRFYDQVDPPFAFEEGFGVVAADRATPKPSFCAAADAVGIDCGT